MDERELHLMRSYPGSVGCLRESMVSIDIPLYMITNVLSPARVTLCVEAEYLCSTFACSLNVSFIVHLVFLERSSLSNPKEARYCDVPRNCTQKEDMLAYVRPKPLLHSFDVPYARLCVLLWFRAKIERSCDSNLAWQQTRTKI